MATPEQVPLKTNTVTTRKSLKASFLYFKDNITIEPILTFHIIPSALAKLATENLNLDKACRVNLGYGDAICDALIAKEGDMYIKQEIAVQEIVAKMESWKNIMLTFIPSIFILFIGAWSDRTGKRKICILLPLVGDLLMCLSNILSTYFFYELRVEATMFLEALFPALAGGWIVTYMGAYAYISDISSEESRTLRIGLASLCLTAGRPIGAVLSGVLLKKIGYYGVFLLSSSLYISCIAYGLFCVKDPKRTKADNRKKSSSVLNFVKSFFDFNHVKSTVQVAFKNGPNGRRIKSILILAGLVFIHGPTYGEGVIKYLYTRYCFNWDALMYSFYNTFFICTHALGSIISVTWFSRHLKWHDSVLGMISTVSKFFGAIATALSTNTLEMYIAVAIETLNGTAYTALRSLSSKLCSSDELGKMVAVFNLVEVATSLSFGSLYSTLYLNTIKINPGIVFHASALFTILPVIIYLWFYIQHKKSLHKFRKNDLEDNNMSIGSIENEIQD